MRTAEPTPPPRVARHAKAQRSAGTQAIGIDPWVPDHHDDRRSGSRGARRQQNDRRGIARIVQPFDRAPGGLREHAIDQLSLSLTPVLTVFPDPWDRAAGLIQLQPTGPRF